MLTNGTKTYTRRRTHPTKENINIVEITYVDNCFTLRLAHIH